jgi:hypothetical protein
LNIKVPVSENIVEGIALPTLVSKLQVLVAEPVEESHNQPTSEVMKGMPADVESVRPNKKAKVETGDTEWNAGYERLKTYFQVTGRIHCWHNIS